MARADIFLNRTARTQNIKPVNRSRPDKEPKKLKPVL